MKLKPIWIVLIVMAVIVPAVLILKKTRNNAQPPVETSITQEVTPSIAPEATSSETISVEAGSFYYKPDVIRVKRGQKVKIELKSVSMMHDFNIDKLNIHAPITKSGETAIFEFTPTEVGEFEYYCSVGKHKAMGQIGKLIVEE